MRSRLISVIFLLWSTSLWAAPGVNLTPSEQKTVESGGIAVRFEKSPEATEGMFLICGYVNAPAERVWGVITDYARYRNLYPELLAHEIRNRTSASEDHYSLFDYPWPLDDRWLLTRVMHDHAKLNISWVRLDGTVKESKGSWQLYPEDQRTFVVYRVIIDPGLRFVPDWFIRWGTGYMAPRVILRIREFVKK